MWWLREASTGWALCPAWQHCWECWTHISPFPLSHLTGLNLWSCKSRPLSAQQLPAIPGAAGCVAPLYGTSLRALLSGLFWCFEWIKKLLKSYQKAAWLLESLLVPCLKPLKVLRLLDLKLACCNFCSVSCFCIKWWFKAMSLLMMPLVHATVNTCTTAASWMLPVCVLVNKTFLLIAELVRTWGHWRKVFLLFLFASIPKWLRFQLALGVSPTTGDYVSLDISC